ncbi:MAG: N-acetylglucosamine-6-phosphate deacetylase [Planctomycetaceae bacterium]|nr:N-acetylglucosamine-6-phosphate deacetylase [Planctomycetaceae bacterium]
MELHGKRYDTGQPVQVTIEGERVKSVTPLEDAHDPESLPIIAPAFYDLQINGHGGIWFGQPGLIPEQVLTALKPHFGFGVTRMFPTLITNSDENLLNGFTSIRQACEQEPWADRLVAGCHLEGPYLSGEDGPRGAHPLEHIRPANWDEFQRWQEASGGRIRLVTIAPETEGAIDFIKRAVDAGIVMSIGHTAAEPDDIQRAVDAGATMSTHLGNGAHGTIRRHPNYIWEQLAEDRLMPGLITDSHHLPASVVKCMVRVKGTENCIITCDASGLAGCPPGIYHEPGLDVEVLEDGKVVVAGQRQYLAGSGASTLDCVAWASKLPDIGLRAACDMAGNQVAKVFGDEEVLFEPGNLADFICLEISESKGTIRMNSTISHGELCYGELTH